jgi:hypothetical protein
LGTALRGSRISFLACLLWPCKSKELNMGTREIEFEEMLLTGPIAERMLRIDGVAITGIFT